MCVVTVHRAATLRMFMYCNRCEVFGARGFASDVLVSTRRKVVQTASESLFGNFNMCAETLYIRKNQWPKLLVHIPRWMVRILLFMG